MAYIDWIILAVLAGGVLRGFMVGAIRQATSLVGVVLAFALAVQHMRDVGDMAVQSFGIAPALGPFVGFVLIFAGVMLLFFAAGRLVEQVVGALKLTLFNRVAGGALGGLKAALLLSVLFMVLVRIDVPDESTRRASLLYKPVADALPQTWEYVADRVPELRRIPEQFGMAEYLPAPLPATAHTRDRRGARLHEGTTETTTLTETATLKEEATPTCSRHR